ncbi:hypothetical protein HY379_02505 [Candidatus Saccharibacteria bacterium]|nr:hypothetical protein [Candidatus Saccharibacteria bacterium]
MDTNPNIHSQLLEKVREYHMPQAARDLLAAHPPLVIAGITASGKSSATSYITDTTQYRQVVSHTTRRPRSDEANGTDYYYVSDEAMLEMVNNRAMVEVQTILGDTVYGISLGAYQDVVNSGYKALLSIDVQGVKEISKYLPDLRPVFLLPPSFERWMEMLEKRGRMSHSERLKRMHSARGELEKALASERFHLVVNQDIPKTAREILGGIRDQSEQHRNRETANILLDRLKTI